MKKFLVSRASFNVIDTLSAHTSISDKNRFFSFTNPNYCLNAVSGNTHLVYNKLQQKQAINLFFTLIYNKDFAKYSMVTNELLRAGDGVFLSFDREFTTQLHRRGTSKPKFGIDTTVACKQNNVSSLVNTFLADNNQVQKCIYVFLNKTKKIPTFVKRFSKIKKRSIPHKQIALSNANLEAWIADLKVDYWRKKDVCEDLGVEFPEIDYDKNNAILDRAADELFSQMGPDE